MNARCRNAVLCLVCAGMLGACATKSDLETLQNQAYRDRQESRKTIQRLEEDLAKSQETLRDDIQKSTSPVQARQANTWAELEALRVQVAKQQEKLETLTMKFNALTAAQGEGPSLADTVRDVQNIKTALQSQFGLELDSAPAAADAAQPAAKAEPSKAKVAEQPKAAEQPAPDVKTNTADALYAKAEAAFKAKKYEQARQYFSEFATNFKKHPNTSQAVFWVGECAYDLQDYGKAILAYQEVIEKYPKSVKYKPAVLKQGMAFFKIGKDKAGKAVLQDLIDRFPKAPEAIRAKQFLKEHK